MMKNKMKDYFKYQKLFYLIILIMTQICFALLIGGTILFILNNLMGIETPLVIIADILIAISDFAWIRHCIEKIKMYRGD